MARKLLSRYADTTGDGLGSVQATGNYAGTPTEFAVTAQADEHIQIERIIVTVEDSGLNSFDNYTAAAPLTNGIQIYVTDADGTVVYYMTDARDTLRTLGAWGHYCFDAQVLSATAGDDHFVAKWTISEYGAPSILLPGWSIKFLCEDDMTALTQHKFLVQGHYLNWGERAQGVYA